jgi:hypothetical protein
MAQPRLVNKAQNEGRLLLALQAYQKNQFKSIKQAATAYQVCDRTLSARLKGRVSRVDSRANGHKLTTTEEEVLEQWILSINERGYPLNNYWRPRCCEITASTSRG